MRCSQAVLTAVLSHARNEAPRECCGILVGSAESIIEALLARNLSEDPNRFVIDPHDHFAARREARARGLQVLGFYHSHPRSEPTPSASDIAEVTYDGCLYLIVSLIATPAARMFRMDRDGPQPLDLTID